MLLYIFCLILCLSKIYLISFAIALSLLKHTFIKSGHRSPWGSFYEYQSACNESLNSKVCSTLLDDVGNLCRCTGYRPIIEGYRTFTKVWFGYLRNRPCLVCIHQVMGN